MHNIERENNDMELNGFQTCHFGDKSILRERRVILGMTQQQTADKAGVILQQYQKFESGERSIMNCSFSIACRVIEALGMDITDFYHGKYVFGEEIYFSPEGLRYKKNGKLTTEEIE